MCTDKGLSILETSLTTREFFLQYIATKGNNAWFHLVNDAKVAGLITDDEILLLWQEGILALEDIRNVICEEVLIMSLEQSVNISERDTHYIFQQWLYRADTFPFTGRRLRMWFDDSGVYDGKVQALIAIALHLTEPGLISVDEVLIKLQDIVTYQPDSHGIHRLLFLAIEMADSNIDNQSLVMEALVGCAARLYFYDRFTYDLFLQTLNEHQSWYATVREIGRQNLRTSLEATLLELQTNIANI